LQESGGVWFFQSFGEGFPRGAGAGAQFPEGGGGGGRLAQGEVSEGDAGPFWRGAGFGLGGMRWLERKTWAWLAGETVFLAPCRFTQPAGRFKLRAGNWKRAPGQEAVGGAGGG